MGRSLSPTAKRPRISVDVAPDLRRRLRLAAAQRDLTVGQYVLQALEERLKKDLKHADKDLLALTAGADPVLARLWENDRDAEYDRL